MVMTMVQLSTPPLFIGVASALTISARTLGGTVGYAIAEVIYNNLSNKKIPDSIGEYPSCVTVLYLHTGAKTMVSTAAAVIPLGFKPQNLGALIGAILSHGPTSTVPDITPEILGAALGATASAQAYAFKITWFTFLPASEPM